LCVKKMTAQAHLIATQSEMIVTECMLEKTNRKLFKILELVEI
jgi:hypothetical protein